MNLLRRYVLPALGITGAIVVVVVALVAFGIVGGPKSNSDPYLAASAAAATSDESTYVEPPPAWKPVKAVPTTIRPGKDSRSLIVRVSVPGGDTNCVRDVTLSVPYPADGFLHAVVKYEALSPILKGTPCAEDKSIDLTVTADLPIGAQDLQFNDDSSNTWHKWGLGYGLCAGSITSGCSLPDDHCGTRSTSDAVGTADPRLADDPSASLKVLGCDPSWLVLDSGSSDLRKEKHYFYRWAGEKGWMPVASGTQGGCADVQPVTSKFPIVLCSPLPALHS
jgi:hypothetical protein